MKRFIVAFLVVLLISFPLNAALAGDSPVNSAASSIVRMAVFDDKGELVAIGSGFAIGDKQPVKYFVTNNHVVESNPYDVRIWRSKDDFVRLTVVQQLPIVDLCLLEVANDQLLYNIPPLPLANKDFASPGLDVYALGFPAADIKDFYSSLPNSMTLMSTRPTAPSTPVTPAAR